MKIATKVERVVATLDGHHSVLEAVRLMNEKYIGSVVVTHNGAVQGIFTERDLMLRVVGERRDPASTPIATVIPGDLITVSPEDSCEHCLEIMREHGCRHLLVHAGSEFIGIVSLRDIVRLMLEEKETLIGQLREYISA
jgi:CBS domain-containing protein